MISQSKSKENEQIHPVVPKQRVSSSKFGAKSNQTREVKLHKINYKRIHKKGTIPILAEPNTCKSTVPICVNTTETTSTEQLNCHATWDRQPHRYLQRVNHEFFDQHRTTSEDNIKFTYWCAYGTKLIDFYYLLLPTYGQYCATFQTSISCADDRCALIDTGGDLLSICFIFFNQTLSARSPIFMGSIIISIL